MQPVHGTLWEPWEALLYLEYCGVLAELSDPRSILFVRETLPFLSPSQRRQDTGGPSELFWRKGGSRGRAEAQETAGNTADGVQRKPEVTTKSHSGARSLLLMPQNPLNGFGRMLGREPK